MAPPLKLSSSKVIRLPQHEVLEQIDAWKLTIPDGADDLDIRAILARAMAGKPPLVAPATGALVSADSKQPEVPKGLGSGFSHPPTSFDTSFGRRSKPLLALTKKQCVQQVLFELVWLHIAIPITWCQENHHLYLRLLRRRSTHSNVRVAMSMWTWIARASYLFGARHVLTRSLPLGSESVLTARMRWDPAMKIFAQIAVKPTLRCRNTCPRLRKLCRNWWLWLQQLNALACSSRLPLSSMQLLSVAGSSCPGSRRWIGLRGCKQSLMGLRKCHGLLITIDGRMSSQIMTSRDSGNRCSSANTLIYLLQQKRRKLSLLLLLLLHLMKVPSFRTCCTSMRTMRSHSV